MVRKRDKFWQYVEDLKGRFKCNFCQRDFAGGITRVKCHLSGIKGHDVDICTEVSLEVQAEAFLVVSGATANKKSRVTTNESHMDESETPSMPSVSKMLHQSTMPQMVKKMDQREVEELLTKFFILNNISFNVIQTPAFIDFMKAVAELGPSFKVPSYSSLRVKLIPAAKDEVDTYVAQVKKSWVKTGCTIMSDTWTDAKSRCIINFIAYSPGGAVFLKAIDISQNQKTGLFLKDVVSEVIESIGPQHVVQFITDNASNFESAGDMLIGKYPTMYKTRCAAHGIQLLLKDIHKEIELVKNSIEDAKAIQAYMYRHTIVTHLMREATNGRELKHPCTTRFAPNFQVLESIIQVENELRSFVASPSWRDLEYSKFSPAKKVTEIIQKSEFWIQGKEVLQILEPLIWVLRLVDGEGSTAAYLYEVMEKAREVMKQRCGDDEASSSACERNWSAFEAAQTKKRNRLTTEMLGNLVHVRMNTMMMESFRLKEQEDMKPIDLNGLSKSTSYFEDDLMQDILLVDQGPNNPIEAESSQSLHDDSSEMREDYCWNMGNYNL